MKKRRLLFVAGLLLVASVVTIAAKYLMPFNRKPVLPPAKEELSALTQHWLSLQKYNISGTVRLYDGKDSNTIKEQTPFSAFKDGRSFYAVLGSMQTICDGKIFIQIDTVNKYLVIAPVSDSIYTATTNGIMPVQKMFDDTTGMRMTTEISGNDISRTLLIADDRTPEIKNTQVVYQAKDYRINTVVIEWWKNTNIANSQETWVTRMNYNYNAVPDVRIDEKISSVITIEKNGAVTVNAQYRDYLLQKEI